MKYLLPLLIAAVVLARLSQQNTERCARSGVPYRTGNDLGYVLLVVLLVLFAGLRTRYNDTENYMRGFLKTPVLQVFLADPRNFNPFTNPLFQLYESVLRTFTDDPQILIFTSAAFTQICMVRFLKTYSKDFTFSIYLYITLGTFVFTLAAIKQVLAMSIMTLAFPALREKNWGKYYLYVLVAVLFHTYAFVFALLPLFKNKPWSMFTLLFIAGMAVILLNFEEAITAFMDQANDLGKSLADYEVFDDATINLFRLAVYAVPPLISLMLYRWVIRGNTGMDNVLIHMSIISFAFMSLGTQSGANMFGRMANYFEIGTICCLPAMLRKSFNAKSYRLISYLACICFFGFFLYANMIKIDFADHYRATSLWALLAP